MGGSGELRFEGHAVGSGSLFAGSGEEVCFCERGGKEGADGHGEYAEADERGWEAVGAREESAEDLRVLFVSG